MKKVTSLLILIAMIVTMFSGCGEKSVKTVTQNNTNVADVVNAVYKKYTPAITLTESQFAWDNSQKYPVGYDMTHNAFTDWAKNTLGIDWQPKFIASDDDSNAQKLALAMASNDLPDVFRADSATITAMAKAGAIMPMDDLIQKYASPLVKYLLQEYQGASNGMLYLPTTYNGKNYGFPACYDWVGTMTSWYRQDILDKLGKKVPTTLAELEDVFTAYKEKYPNGVARFIDKDLVGTESVFAAYGVYPKIWTQDSSGNLIYNSIQPGAKQGLATLRKWYQNGWLDKEFIVKDYDKAAATFSAGNMLDFEGPWSTVWSPLPSLANNVPNAVIVPGPFLKGPEGKSGAQINPPMSGGFAISAKCKNPEAVIYQFNLQMDSAYRNDKELRAKFKFYYQAEDPQQPINASQITGNGDLAMQKYNYKQAAPGNDMHNFANSYIGNYWGITMNQRPTELMDSLITTQKGLGNGTISAADKKSWSSNFGGSKMVQQACLENIDILVNEKNAGQYVMNKFVGPPTKGMIDKSSYLDKLELETYSNIIMGEAPLSDFDKFVETWKKSGGDQITAEVNDWYSKSKKLMKNN